MMRREPMKRIKRHIITIIFPAVFVFLATVPTGIGFETEVQAAGQGGSVTIDGIRYLLMDLSSGSMGRAELDPDSTLSEVYIRNEVEYLGEYYPVNEFWWDEEDFMIDSDDSFGEGWNQADLDETNPAHESLRKITFAPDITVQGRAISFKQLEEVVFEGKVSYTDGVYYFNCPKLKTITLPSSYWEPDLGEYAIDVKRCPSVRIVAEESNPHFQVIDNDVYSKDGKTLCNVTGSAKEYRIKDSVENIGEYAFNSNDTIRSVTMPDSVKNIGRYAFANMEKLSSVRLSKSLKKLEESIFFNCKKLKKLDVPKNIKRFDNSFCWEKNKLRKIIIRTKNIKKGDFSYFSEKCTAYVRSKKVKKQLRKFKFKGKIVVKKNL